MVRAPLHFHGRIPVPEVAPLTYRDSVTHLELVYELSQYLKNILHPSLQSTVDQVVADAERLLSEANDQYVDGVQEFQRIHDAFMSDVNASLVALNDTAVSDLVDDGTSLLHRSLQSVFANQDQLNEHAVNAADYGATPGSPDSTQGIQDAIDYAHEHGIPRVIVNGTHWIQSHLDGDTGGSPLRQQGGVVLRDNITLDLRGATLQAIPNNSRRYNVVRIDDCDNAAILGGRIKGERHEHTDLNGGEWGMGIHIHNSTNVTIQDTLITECWGDGIYMAAEPEHHNENVHIDGIVSRGNRRQGMSIIGGRNIHVTRSVFTETRGALPESGVDIEPNHEDTICQNISFRDCEFTNNAVYGFTTMSAGNAVQGVTLENCYVANNQVAGTSNAQLRFVRGCHNIVIRNTVSEVTPNGIALELRVHDAIVDGCTLDGRVTLSPHEGTAEYKFTNNTVNDNITIGSRVHAHITNNRISTETDVTRIYQPVDCVLVFEGNTFTATDYIPIHMTLNSNVKLSVIGNVFEGYGEYAVYPRSTAGVTIMGNQFTTGNDSRAAVYISGDTTNANLTGNVHTGNGALARFAGAMTDVRMSNNTSNTLFTGTPQSSTARNVWIERSPVEWWHDGQTVNLGA